MDIAAIVLAAGRGLRFNSRIPKVLFKINSKPILIYSLLVFSRHPLVKDIILVVNAKNYSSVVNEIKKYRIDKISKIVQGGERRQDSVLKGLETLDSRADLVLIHDAVRPFITKEMVCSVIRQGQRAGAAVVGVPVKATIKEVKTQKSKRKTKSIVKETLNRNNLWEIQTPQVFKKELLLKAYKRFGNVSVTDDAMLVEKLGAKVSVVLGSYKNIKITTPEDLVIARAILKLKTQNANLKTAR